MLLLWISFIIIIPFELSRLDGSLKGQMSMINQIMIIAKVRNLCVFVCVVRVFVYVCVRL